MLVNSKGRGCTQRVEPKLALIQVELPPEAFAEDWQPTPDDHMGMGLLLNCSSSLIPSRKPPQDNSDRYSDKCQLICYSECNCVFPANNKVNNNLMK